MARGTGVRRMRSLTLPALAACFFSGAGLTIMGTMAAADDPAPKVEERTDDMALLSAIKSRESAVAAREAELSAREKIVAESSAVVQSELRNLQDAEARLAKLVEQIDSASRKDIEQLTAVYAAMKPKDAAALFAEMPPEFAAGFLGAMKPDQAAAIMAAVEPRIGYGISVLLAGRNAALRQKAEGELK